MRIESSSDTGAVRGTTTARAEIAARAPVATATVTAAAVAVAVAVAALGTLPACAGGPALPDPPIHRALARDLTRVVDVRQKIGWLVDDVEVEAVLPDALKSVCRVPEADRTATLGWLDAEVVRQGGPPVDAWRRAGKDLDEIQELLLLSRARLVLSRADEWARAGKCPFWIEPEPAFDGVHVFTHRWILTLEGGGRLIVGIEDGVVGAGGGGGGRVMGGYGITERFSLLLALDGGGGARFTDVPLGERVSVPDFLATFALPAVGRFAFGQSGFIDAELGPMTYLNQVNGQFEMGVRSGVSLGGWVLRLNRGLVPRVTFGMTVDFAPGRGANPTVTQISAGLRAGFDLSR